jgi:beta-N-acetylhexosaminidase
VVDLDINPDNPAIGRKARSFSATPEIVIQHAAWTIQEFHRYQILTSLKHFPGQGSAQDDSHLGFTDVTSTYTRAELAPFRRLIEMDLADSVMVAHIFHGDWDSTSPASLSKPIITGILRKQLTYDGVVISDCLQMGAISNYYNLEETIRLAIDAGNDILLFSNNLAYESTITERAISIIKQLIEKNVISEQRIFESLERIKSMKNRVNTLDYS